MKIRKPLLVIAIFILATGLFLFANATVRQTHSSSSSSSSNGPSWGQVFEYSGETLTPDNPPQFIVGTTGVADIIILNTPFRDFSTWVCHQLPGYTLDCASFGGGNNFNLTILNSYLQTHQSQIVYSKIIVDQNVTLDYHVGTPTDVTIVLAHIGSGMTRDYWQLTKSNQTLTYPLLGYTERLGSTWNLTNVSLGIITAGAIGLIFALISFKTHPLRKSRPYQGSETQKCPQCGQENLFFAEKCLHCGSILRDETPMVAPPHQH